MKVSPILSQEIAAFTTEVDVPQLVQEHGSPLHIIFPEAILRNVERFREIFRINNVIGEIFFAVKANKSTALTNVAASNGVGLEVSSKYELQHATTSRAREGGMILSGPSKSDEFIDLGIQNKGVISVDSPDELTKVIKLAKREAGKERLNILLRVSGLNKKISRFGISMDELEMCYKIMRENLDIINFSGFSFHLDGYSSQERAVVIATLTNEINHARANGFQCDVIDMGGGFRVRYTDEGSWREFIDGPSSDPANYFAGNVPGHLYPYWSETAGPEQLDEILNISVEGHIVGDGLREHSIRLFIEPGRALLDQAGITAMRVTGTRRFTDGSVIVGVDGNINHLSEQWFGTDFVPDPIHVAVGGANTISVRASVGGNTCMENDMVTWRKVDFDSTPKEGDVLVYTNTAGYQMDSNESEFHRYPIPRKVIANRGNSLDWEITNDK